MEKDGGKREETYARRIRDIAVTTFFSGARSDRAERGMLARNAQLIKYPIPCCFGSRYFD